MSKSKAKKEQLMLEYKKQRRNKILALIAIVIVGLAVTAGLVFAATRDKASNPNDNHVHGDACAH